MLLSTTTSCKRPPDKLRATDVSPVHSILVNGDSAVRLSQDEIDYWRGLEFEMAKDSPGETPDFVTALISDRSEFIAIYNKDDNVVFLSFVPEIGYGLINSPPPGGWTQPLYTTAATEDLLKLLRAR